MLCEHFTAVFCLFIFLIHKLYLFCSCPFNFLFELVTIIKVFSFNLKYKITPSCFYILCLWITITTFSIVRPSPPANPSLQTLYLRPTLFLCLWPTYMEHSPTFPPSKTLPLCFPVWPQDLPLSTLLTLFPHLHQGPVPQPSYVLVCLSALVCVRCTPASVRCMWNPSKMRVWGLSARLELLLIYKISAL